MTTFLERPQRVFSKAFFRHSLAKAAHMARTAIREGGYALNMDTAHVGQGQGRAGGLAAALAEEGFCEYVAHAPFADFAFTFLGLSRRGHDAQEIWLADMRRAAPFALLMDWRLPERNLDIPAAMLTHTACAFMTPWNEHVRAYLRGGALEGILYRHRHDITVLARDFGVRGSLGIALVAWNKPIEV